MLRNYLLLIVFIDDKCPFKTGDKVKNIFSTSNKVKVIFNSRNLGVGGATKLGIDFLEKQNWGHFFSKARGCKG